MCFDLLRLLLFLMNEWIPCASTKFLVQNPHRQRPILKQESISLLIAFFPSLSIPISGASWDSQWRGRRLCPCLIPMRPNNHGLFGRQIQFQITSTFVLTPLVTLIFLLLFTFFRRSGSMASLWWIWLQFDEEPSPVVSYMNVKCESLSFIANQTWFWFNLSNYDKIWSFHIFSNKFVFFLLCRINQ